MKNRPDSVKKTYLETKRSKVEIFGKEILNRRSMFFVKSIKKKTLEMYRENDG